jgi:hypothetical protein
MSPQTHKDSPLAQALAQPPRISPEEATRRVAKELLSHRGAIRWYQLVAKLSEEIQDIRPINFAIDEMIKGGYITQKQTWLRKNERTKELL